MRKIIISLATATTALIILAATYVSAKPDFEAAAINSCVKGSAVAAFSSGLLRPVNEIAINTANLTDSDNIPSYSQLISTIATELENNVLTTDAYTVMTSLADTVTLPTSILLNSGSDSPERISVYTCVYNNAVWALQELTTHNTLSGMITIDLPGHQSVLIFQYRREGSANPAAPVNPVNPETQPPTTAPHVYPLIPPFIIPTQPVSEPASMTTAPSEAINITESDVSEPDDTIHTTSPITGEPIR